MGLFDGNRKKVKADALATDINAAGKQGIDYLRGGASAANAVYDEDPTATVNSQIGAENQMARAAADDAIRRTQSLIAQRGLSNSSIGLGAEMGQRKSLMDTISRNNASGISRLRDMRLQNALGKMNVGNNLYQIKANPGQIQMNSYSYRTGGIGKLAGTLAGAGIGGAVGGPAGAGIGASLGGSIGGYAQEG